MDLKELHSYSPYNCQARFTIDNNFCSKNNIDVWCAPLNILAIFQAELSYYLTQGELRRAKQYQSIESHDHYVLGRIMVRLIVGRLLNIDTRCIEIATSLNGKPRLCLPEDKHLCFNISHSGNYVLVAFARHRDIGIDVEAVQPEVIISEIAHHLFSPHELTSFQLLPLYVQRSEFFRCWCRKEAFVKGLGLGLSLPLTEFELIAMDPVLPRQYRIATKSFDPDGWRVLDICLDHRHMAALAVHGPVSALRIWTISANLDCS